jgi:hypothetical protein
MKKLVAFLLFILVWIGLKVVSNLSLVDFINQSFLVGMIALLIGACFVIFQSGFLSLFFEGFKRIGSFVTPKSRAMERTNRLIEEDAGFQSFKKNLSKNVVIWAFLIGFSSITVSVIGMVLN